MKLPAPDKIAHALLGCSAAALASPFGLGAMVVAPIVVGALKEAYDATGRGNVEWLDFVYTVSGGAVFVGWILLLK